MKPSLVIRSIMWSPSTFLENLVSSHETQKCCFVRVLCPEEELPKSPRNGLGCDMRLGI
jgi:hypothetical protein